MTNVLKFVAPPKTMNRNYKQHKYTVSFVPSTKQWEWCVEIVQTTVFKDIAPTQIKAFRAAVKFIDSVRTNQGVS